MHSISPIEKERMYQRYLDFCKTMEEPDTDYLFEDTHASKLREMTRSEFYETLEFSRRDQYMERFGSDMETLVEDSHNRLILVYSIDIGNILPHEADQYMNQIIKTMADDIYLQYFIPVRNQPSKVECINPKLVDDDYMETVRSVLEDSQQKMFELLSELKPDETISTSVLPEPPQSKRIIEGRKIHPETGSSYKHGWFKRTILRLIGDVDEAEKSL